MRKTRLLLAVAVLATPLVWMPHANACSCMQTDPRDRLHQSDGAFIGTYTGREPADPTEPYGEHDYFFETEKVFKGDIGDVVEVRAPENGAGCGLEYSEGSRGALFLRKEGEVWHSSLCETVHPDLLERAARPFPQPNAKEPPRLLVGGSFGEVRVMALDEKGRTAGYGYGEGDALFMSRCPRGRKVTELVRPDGRGRPFVDVRRLRDLKVRRTTKAPRAWRDQRVYPLAAICVSADGDTVVAGRSATGDGLSMHLLLFENDRVSTIAELPGTTVALGRDEAYVGDGRKLVAVDYTRRAPRTLHTFDKPVSQVAISVHGVRLAVVTGITYESDDPPPHTFVVRAEDGEVVAERVVAGSNVYTLVLQWVAPKRLLHSRSSDAVVLDPRLERDARIKGGFPFSAVASGCEIFGVGYGALFEASACKGGGADTVRTFFSPVTNVVVRLPWRTKVDAPPS